MSRIGKIPIEIPQGVTATQEVGVIKIKGKEGELIYTVPEGLKVDIADNKISVTCQKEDRNTKKIFGLTRTLISNMLGGVNHGYEKKLVLSGVGYKAQAQGNKITLNVGYSHAIDYVIPDGIKVDVQKGTEVAIKGIDKKLVGDIAARIRNFCKPEPYKGKGIAYADEKIRRKAGKAVS